MWIIILVIAILLVLFISKELFVEYMIDRTVIYLGATYTNGYMTVIVDNFSTNEVECYDIKSESMIRIDKETFVRQFKLKETYISWEE